MALSDDKKTSGKAADAHARDAEPIPVQRSGADRDVGHALRSVYARTVSEAIPPELLDLLGKLS